MDFSAVPPTDSESAPQEFHPNPNAPNPVFFNETGLRPGWRLLLYLSIGAFLYLFEIIAISLHYRTAPSQFLVSTVVLGELISLIAAYSPALVMAKIEQCTTGSYGLPFRSAFGLRFWQGTLVGISEISLLVGAMTLFGAYSFGSLTFHGAKILQWGLIWLGASVLIALSEEFLFRGYTQVTLAEGIGFWPAAVVLSILFGLVHRMNPGENWTGVSNIVLTGLLWAFTIRRTGTLWFAVGWHAAFDFGESFLYSVPNSGGVFEGHLSNATIAHGRAWLTGGDVGPEASVFAFVTLGLGALLVHLWFPAQRQAHNESQSPTS